jgi:broad specificity phosphatase PhoE
MTATILLIRHASHVGLGEVLSGRAAGLSLSAVGAEQARELARRLEPEQIDAVHASPIERAQETAIAVARRRGLEVTTVEALNEVDFGRWCGRRFAELSEDPRWGEWNVRRSKVRAPEGETMSQVQQRAWEHVMDVGRSMAGQIVAMVTHCDVIRAVIAAILGLSLDHILRFDVAPASVSRLVAGEWGARVVSINEVTG